MFGSIWDDIRRKFRNGDTITQLIIINIAVWASLIILGVFARLGGTDMNGLAEYLSVHADGLMLLKRPWTIITYMFTHVDLLHILFNMLWLYWFGEVLRYYLGNHRIIPVYIYGGLVGFVLYFLSANLFPDIFYDLNGTHMLGASAGVMAVMWAAVAIAPTHVFNLLLIGPVQIRYIAIFFVLMDLISIQSYSNTGGHLAHIGGAFLGYFFIQQLKEGNDWSTGFNKFLENTKNYFANFNKPKPQRPKQEKQYSSSKSETRKGPRMGYKNTKKQQEPRSARRERNTTADEQAQIDAILDKIKDSGYDNLTSEEKAFLFKVSNKK